MTEYIKDVLNCWSSIIPTIKHYRQYLKLEKKLLGYYKYKFHDIDKILMYILFPFLGKNKIQKIHRYICPHHLTKYKTANKVNFEALVIDWESCKYKKRKDRYSVSALTHLNSMKYISVENYNLIMEQIMKFNLYHSEI